MQNIIIPNPTQLEKTIEIIKRDGKDKLHILSDFDLTLTKSFIKGQKIPSVIAQIREGGYLGEDYVKNAFLLHDIYHPIEISSKISHEEKNIKMHEWWKKHFELLIKSGMNKEVINEIVKKKLIPFRECSKEFLELLNKNNIPLVIMSAAPGDIIIEAFKFEKIYHKNIYLIANMFIWNNNGIAIGVKEPIIHSLNKHEIEIKSLPIYQELLNRKNVILMGDLIEDLDMIKGFPYKNLIKIAFLNKNINTNLEDYKKHFDIIITNDSDMNYVLGLLKRIIN